MIENGFRLFGCGDLNDYGSYTLVVANSKEMAYEILSEYLFKIWKNDIYYGKECGCFDDDGNPLNGYAQKTLENEANGLFRMDEDTLFMYYKDNLFSIDSVVDLKTNIWDDEHA